MTVQNSSRVAALRNIATRLRIDSIRATSTAGSGHPSTCCSAAEIVSALFFSEMRYDANDLQHPYSDRFILSKGHAAPLLYAVWAEAGLIPRDELLKLRTIESNLEGHPTPRLAFVALPVSLLHAPQHVLLFAGQLRARKAEAPNPLRLGKQCLESRVKAPVGHARAQAAQHVRGPERRLEPVR